jgi:hypothetical protein
MNASNESNRVEKFRVATAATSRVLISLSHRVLFKHLSPASHDLIISSLIASLRQCMRHRRTIVSNDSELPAFTLTDAFSLSEGAGFVHECSRGAHVRSMACTERR